MITINITKAKEVAHQKRRDARSKEFAPHDEVIAKQIPGQSQQAEQSRQAIREKYIVIQQDIDASKNIDALKQVLEKI